ncbi:hypothetical protein [Wolbachia pipientis]|uniref:hypothetical protein n=1 Tax=Wolbachia pipientis TaxID=955 RepID=UPI00168144A2|nr:hypothetical protein [Wolbachia pipientis]MBA8752871.1 hypothetical protein [Wolbachia pipientis]
MLSLKGGTIKVDRSEIVLVIGKDDHKEFKKYKDVGRDGTIIDDKFYCTLNDQQLYITGFYPQEGLGGDNVTINVKSVGVKGNKYFTDHKKMKSLLHLNDEEKEIMVKTLSCHPTVQLLEEKNVKITELKAAKEQLKAKKDEIKDLQNRLTEAEEKNRKLEDKSKTTEQPKQGNGARYTATVGMGLAAGLIAFTALKRTVKLEMLVMIGIAVASALVAGGITYAVLLSTQVDGAKAQEVNENGKKK